MKSLLSFVFFLGTFVILGVFGFSHVQKLENNHNYEKELARIKRSFLINTTGLYLLDTDTYRQEIGIHLSKYFYALKTLQKTYPKIYNIKRELEIGEKLYQEKGINAEQKEARNERINIVLKLFQQMNQGGYKAVYSATDKNFRFDIYDLSSDTLNGEKQIKLSYIHFGPYHNQKINNNFISYQEIRGKYIIPQKNNKFPKINEIAGESQPPSLQINPERWIKEFPPGIEIGYYGLPLAPFDADKIRLSFRFGIRTIGGTENLAQINFPSIDIQENWRIEEGKKWAGEERLLTDKELQEFSKNKKTFK